MTKTSFGQYLRNKRVAAGRSLREVAEGVGITHVYLGEVERGVRAPFKPEYWPKLAKAIPRVLESELARHAERSRPVQLDIQDAPPRYQDLALALARRMEERDLTDRDLDQALRILRGNKDDGVT